MLCFKFFLDVVFVMIIFVVVEINSVGICEIILFFIVSIVNCEVVFWMDIFCWSILIMILKIILIIIMMILVIVLFFINLLVLFIVL